MAACDTNDNVTYLIQESLLYAPLLSIIHTYIYYCIVVIFSRWNSMSPKDKCCSIWEYNICWMLPPANHYHIYYPLHPFHFVIFKFNKVSNSNRQTCIRTYIPTIHQKICNTLWLANKQWLCSNILTCEGSPIISSSINFLWSMVLSFHLLNSSRTFWFFFSKWRNIATDACSCCVNDRLSSLVHTNKHHTI